LWSYFDIQNLRLAILYLSMPTSIDDLYFDPYGDAIC
jgi:hypothetical protein